MNQVPPSFRIVQQQPRQISGQNQHVQYVNANGISVSAGNGAAYFPASSLQQQQQRTLMFYPVQRGPLATPGPSFMLQNQNGFPSQQQQQAQQTLFQQQQHALQMLNPYGQYHLRQQQLQQRQQQQQHQAQLPVASQQQHTVAQQHFQQQQQQRPSFQQVLHHPISSASVLSPSCQSFADGVVRHALCPFGCGELLPTTTLDLETHLQKRHIFNKQQVCASLPPQLSAASSMPQLERIRQQVQIQPQVTLQAPQAAVNVSNVAAEHRHQQNHNQHRESRQQLPQASTDPQPSIAAPRPQTPSSASCLSCGEVMLAADLKKHTSEKHFEMAYQCSDCSFMDHRSHVMQVHSKERNHRLISIHSPTYAKLLGKLSSVYALHSQVAAKLGSTDEVMKAMDSAFAAPAEKSIAENETPQPSSLEEDMLIATEENGSVSGLMQGGDSSASSLSNVTHRESLANIPARTKLALNCNAVGDSPNPACTSSDVSNQVVSSLSSSTLPVEGHTPDSSHNSNTGVADAANAEEDTHICVIKQEIPDSVNEEDVPAPTAYLNLRFGAVTLRDDASAPSPANTLPTSTAPDLASNGQVVSASSSNAASFVPAQPAHQPVGDFVQPKASVGVSDNTATASQATQLLPGTNSLPDAQRDGLSAKRQPPVTVERAVSSLGEGELCRVCQMLNGAGKRYVGQEKHNHVQVHYEMHANEADKVDYKKFELMARLWKTCFPLPNDDQSSQSGFNRSVVSKAKSPSGSTSASIRSRGQTPVDTKMSNTPSVATASQSVPTRNSDRTRNGLNRELKMLLENQADFLKSGGAGQTPDDNRAASSSSLRKESSERSRIGALSRGQREEGSVSVSPSNRSRSKRPRSPSAGERSFVVAGTEAASSADSATNRRRGSLRLQNFDVVCNVCEMHVKRSEVEEHIYRQHCGELPYMCKACGFRAVSFKAVKNHGDLTHADGRYEIAQPSSHSRLEFTRYYDLCFKDLCLELPRVKKKKPSADLKKRSEVKLEK